MNVPQHVAIILDGNGRWAKSKGMPRNYGHVQGAKRVENICEEAYKMGIEYLTVYAFSTENWSRPQDEVGALMTLLRDYLKTCIKTAKDNNMCVRIIGDKSGLPVDVVDAVNKLEEATRDMTGLHFQIALNYGSQDEMIRAMNAILKNTQEGKRSGDITKEEFEEYLDTKGIPTPDLLIRTSGEQRLSNFLLWQLAYAEFYFTDIHWPDFDKTELMKAVEVYNKRNRRFGKVEEE